MSCVVAPAVALIAANSAKKRVLAKYHIDWLIMMLSGGVIMLLLDHIINGEIVAYFPFFTRSWSQIWPEILKVGLPMTAAIFLVWGGMVLVANYRLKAISTEA